MKNKTQMIFLIGAAVSAVLLIGVGVMLFLSFSKLKQTERAIDSKRRELAAYYERNPFPSPENVQMEIDNGKALQEWFETLMQESGKGQLTLEMRRPSQFMRLLGDTRKRLIPLANAEGADVVDPSFAFGFERYLEEGSELPSPVHVPRLAHQLLILDRVCTILFEEGVTKLTTTRREVFEGGAVVSRRRSGAAPVQSDAGELKEGDLYARMRFSVEFEAREPALVRAIDRLASNELFIVVNSLDCRKVGEDIAMEKIPESGTLNLNPDEEGLEVDQLGRLFPSRYERVISGPEAETPMSVTLNFDVYRFAEVASP